MVTAMALAKCIPPTFCSLINTRPALKTPNSRLSPVFPQLGLSIFSPWNGLRHLGISTRQKSLQLERKGKCKGKAIYASLFGVGAPEALVIGVVALLVFGPKGLAEIARNLGKTLRTFQPTIRELRDVSREFKSSLEREIGLDDVQRSPQNTYTNTNSTPSSISSSEDSEAGVDPNDAPSPNRAYSSEEYLKITEEQLKASAARQERQPPSPPIETQFEQPQSHPQGNVEDAASQMPQPQKPDSDKRNLV